MADSNWQVRVGTKIQDDIQKQLDTMPKKTVTVKAVLDNTGLKTLGSTELTKYEDGLGNVVVASKKFDASGKELNNTIKSVKSTVDTTSQTLQTASKHTKTLGQDFIDTAGKVAKFGAITAIFGLVTTAISESVKSVKELDSSLTELQKVTDLSGDSLQNYTEQAFSMARDLKSTASDVTDAVTEFAKSNYTLEESQLLAEQALIFKTIADGAVTASDSATMLIQVMKAYNMTVSESEHIVNSINEVSNQYALSSSDLSNSIGKVASSAKTAGVDFESLLGLMTAGTEVTQNASKTANGLKSILVNLMSDKLSDQFKEFGIDMRDSNLEMKDGYTILQELSNAYNNMELVADETGESLITTNDNMNKLLEDLGGKYNINTLTAILGNFDNAINATESAFNSANSASDEYAVAMDSIAKKTEGLQGSFQELVWGNGGLGNFLKLLLDGTTLLLNFANDTKALNIILADLAVILAINLIPSMGKMLLSIVTMTTGAIPNAIGAWKAYSAGIVSANTAISASIPLIGLVMVALSGMVMAYNKVKASQEEATRQAKESLSTYTQQSKASADTISKINDEATSRQQLEATIKSLNSNYSDEELALKNVNDLRADAISLLYEEAKAKAQQTVRETGSEYVKSQSFMDSGYEAIGIDFKSPAEALSFLNEKLDDYNERISRGEELLKIEKAGLAELQEQQVELSGKVNDATSIVDGYENAQKTLNSTQEQWVKSAQESTEVQDEQNKVISNAVKSKEELVESYDKLSDSTSSISSELSSLGSALQEQDEQNGLSLDTQLKLIDSGYALALSYNEQTGAVTLNEEAMVKLVKAKIENQIADLNILQSDIQDKLVADGQTALESAKGFLYLAKAKNESTLDYIQRTSGASGYDEEIKQWNDAEAQINALESSMSSISVGGLRSFSGATSKASSATDKLQSSVESLLKEYLEDKIDDLKKAEESEVKVLENRITILEKNRDTQLDSIDAQIDGIEKLQDAEEMRVDNEINQLEKQKSAVESYYDAQISALEKANTERERQIKLMELEEALSKAKATKVMVMTDTGWQAKEDESAVSSAEQNLSDYQGELAYTTQIEQLEALKASAVANIDSQIAKWEEYKTTMQNNYASQISALETYRTTVEQSYATQIETLEENIEIIQEQYDLQIEQLEVFKDNVDMFVENLSSAEQTRLANQLNTMKSTASNYQTDLENLKEYVNKFNAILAVKGSAGATVSTGTSVGSSTANSQKTRGYASGVASVSSNEIAMIGDNPSNRELVIGSKLNGTATMLSQGSGVVNAQSTKSLAGILNTLGSSMGLNGQTMGMNTTNQSNATSQSIQIANITLPSVTNGQGLLDELRGFASGMLQTAYSNG